MIDGEPLKRIQDNGTFLGHRIPLLGFKRIEVINNPGSAIYGADAFGGIVHAVSYEPGEMPSEVILRAGSFDTREISLSHALDIKDTTLQFALDYHLTDGDDTRIIEKDLQSTFDSIFGTNVSRAPSPLNMEADIYTLKAGWNWKNLDLKVLSWNSHKTGLGVGIAAAMDPDGWTSQRSDSYDLNIDLADCLPTGSLDLSIGHQSVDTKVDFTIFPAGTRLPIGPDGNIDFANTINLVDFPDGYIGIPGGNHDKQYARLTNTLSPHSAHTVRWEVGYEHTSVSPSESKNFGPGVIDGTQLTVDGTLTNVTGTPFIFLPNAERHQYYLSLQDEWAINSSFKATIGARHDDFSDFGSTTNFRLGLIYRINDQLQLKAFSGSAYRAPSFVDLFSSNNPSAVGNPNLRPESIDTLETGFNFIYSVNESITSTFSLFNYKADNIIEYVTDPVSGVQTTENIGEQNANGFEISTQWQARKTLRVDFNYSYLDSKDALKRTTPNVPLNMANIGVNWRPKENWNLYFGSKWVSDRNREPGDNRAKIEDYVWSKLSLSRHFENVRFQVTIDNLFDTDAREPSSSSIPNDYPLKSRSILAEVGYQF